MRALPWTLFVLCLGSAIANGQPAPATASPEQPVAPVEPAAEPGRVTTPVPDAEPAPPPAPPAPADEAPATTPSPGPETPVEELPAELTEEELQQLGLDAEDPAVDDDVQLSGFIDFGFVVALGDTRGIMGKPSFGIGNLNVYLSKNLTSSVRTMLEVRLLYLPNGSPKSLADRTLISTAAADYTDFNRELRWGGIEIERVYVEWGVHRLLTIRAGQFLTPYGVWNVDHGTPTIVPIQRPFVIGYNFFPERQTGLELYGRWEATNNGTIGYHLTLSNGTGPVSEYLDFDDNKAVGGRLYWEDRSLGVLTLGGSAYYGRYTSSTQSGTFVDGKVKLVDKVTAQWDSLALALDATFKYAGIHLQAEFVTQQLAYTPEGRTASFSLATFQNTYPSDVFRFGGYLLLGYRFEWLGVMPYVVIQRVGGVDPTQQAEDRSTPLVFGLNVRPIESLVGKLEYVHVLFDEGVPFPGFDMQVLNLQLAWAF